MATWKFINNDSGNGMLPDWHWDNCPSASEATLKNMGKYISHELYRKWWNHHNVIIKQNKPPPYFYGIYNTIVIDALRPDNTKASLGEEHWDHPSSISLYQGQEVLGPNM